MGPCGKSFEIWSPISRTRVWIWSAVRKTRGTNAIRRRPSVGVVQSRAAGADVDVRGSGFTRNRARKRVIGNLPGLEIAAQPHAFGIARIDGHVHAAGMIE